MPFADNHNTSSLIAALSNVDTTLSAIAGTGASPAQYTPGPDSFCHRITFEQLKTLWQTNTQWAIWCAEHSRDWRLLDMLALKASTENMHELVTAVARNEHTDDTTLARLIGDIHPISIFDGHHTAWAAAGETGRAALGQLASRWFHNGVTGYSSYGVTCNQRTIERLKRRINLLAHNDSDRRRARAFAKLTNAHTLATGPRAVASALRLVARWTSHDGAVDRFHQRWPQLARTIEARTRPVMTDDRTTAAWQLGDHDALRHWVETTTIARLRTETNPATVDAIRDRISLLSGQEVLTGWSGRCIIVDAVIANSRPHKRISHLRNLLAEPSHASETGNLAALVLESELLQQDIVENLYDTWHGKHPHQHTSGDSTRCYGCDQYSTLVSILVNPQLDQERLDAAIATISRHGDLAAAAAIARNRNLTVRQLAELLSVVDTAAAQADTVNGQFPFDTWHACGNIAAHPNADTAVRTRARGHAPIGLVNDNGPTGISTWDWAVWVAAGHVLDRRVGSDRRSWAIIDGLLDTWHGNARQLADTVNSLT